MTEEQWLNATLPQTMLMHLWGRASQRKLRLFAVACCRRIWHLLTDERSREAVAAAEQFADEKIDAQALRVAHAAACPVVTTASDPAYAPAQAALCAAAPKPVRLVLYYANKAIALAQAQNVTDAWSELMKGGYAAYCDLLRELFGNPFRPVAFDPFWTIGNDGTVLKLAQVIYDNGAFDRLPILADALEEAGCSDPDLLGHLRGPGPHVRGCWAVDLILGRE